METSILSEKQTDILDFRELRPSEKIIGFGFSKNGRKYNLVQNSKGRRYLIPTCSYKQFNAINKATK